MITAITQNELVLLAYNELPNERHNQMLKLIEQDANLCKAYNDIKLQMEVLDTLEFKPHPTSVQIVLEESCSSSSLEMI
ncbi:MAG: hypothetical protein COA58_03495 [Bacteroidetes bacterium]|nr:MAG: hypothetical protein COA58_03495 [Bacteroidota bacterium]